MILTLIFISIDLFLRLRLAFVDFTIIRSELDCTGERKRER